MNAGLAAAWLAHVALEFWLGRTERVKANSVLELLLNGASYALNLLFEGKR